MAARGRQPPYGDMAVLETQPRDEVLRMGPNLLEPAGKRRYMLAGTSSGIYGEAAARNFVALVELSEQYA